MQVTHVQNKLDLSPEQVSDCIKNINFGFMFAPLHHKAMKNVAASRKNIAPNKTIFNMLGPITNPANAQLQIIGVFDKDAMKIIADSLLELETSRAIVLTSRDGMDEASIYTQTDIIGSMLVDKLNILLIRENMAYQ